VNIFLEVFQGKRTTTPLRSDRNEKYPTYRQLVVEPISPLTETPKKKILTKGDGNNSSHSFVTTPSNYLTNRILPLGVCPPAPLSMILSHTSFTAARCFYGGA